MYIDLLYLVLQLNGKYFRFSGRHFGLPACGFVGQIGQSDDELLDPDNMG